MNDTTTRTRGGTHGQPHVLITTEEQTQEQCGRPLIGNHACAQMLAAMPVTERRLQLAGVSTAVLEGGDGPPVVLLHGPGGYATHWMWGIPGLVTTDHVIASDLPGHGTSEVTDSPLDPGRIRTWLGKLIERTGVSPPALIGQSLGGAIAARLASDQSARLSRLVLVDTFGLTPFQPAPEFELALTQVLAQPVMQRRQP